MAMRGHTAQILIFLLSFLYVTAVENGAFRKRLRTISAQHAAQKKLGAKIRDVDDTADDEDDDSADTADSDTDGGDDDHVVVVDDPEEQDSSKVNATVLADKMPAAPAVNLQKAGPWNKTHTTMTVSADFECEYNKDRDYEADVDHPEANVRCAELELLTNSVTDAQSALQKNLNAQQETEVRTTAITDKVAAETMIQRHETVVANETQSAGLAMFLGGYWREMRMFAKPFYKEHLQEKQEDLKKQEKQLQSDLDAAEERLEAEKAKYKAEDAAEKARHAVKKASEDKKEAVKLMAEEAEDEAEEAESKAEELDARDDDEKKEAEQKEARAEEDERKLEEK